MKRAPKRLPTERNMFPSKLMRQNNVQRVYKAHYRGRPNAEIASRLGLKRSSVDEWLGEPSWFYPWIDEVVIDRAMLGDRAAFDAMTAFERIEFLDRLEVKRRTEVYRRPETLHHGSGNDYDSDIYVLGLALKLPTLARIVSQRVMRVNRKRQGKAAA